jgi:hypothetical protein
VLQEHQAHDRFSWIALSTAVARDITVEVDTGTASRGVFLVRQTIDVSLQCGIDVLRAEHAIPYR